MPGAANKLSDKSSARTIVRVRACVVCVCVCLPPPPCQGKEHLADVKENSFWTDLQWNDTMSYKNVDYQLEMQDNVYNFEVASTDMLFKLFEMYESESKRVIETPVYWNQPLGILTTEEQPTPSESNPDHGPMALVYPALDLALKCSHVFNLLDARGAIGVTERANYINRIRARVRACCLKHVEQFAIPA